MISALQENQKERSKPRGILGSAAVEWSLLGSTLILIFMRQAEYPALLLWTLSWALFAVYGVRLFAHLRKKPLGQVIGKLHFGGGFWGVGALCTLYAILGEKLWHRWIASPDVFEILRESGPTWWVDLGSEIFVASLLSFFWPNYWLTSGSFEGFLLFAIPLSVYSIYAWLGSDPPPPVVYSGEDLTGFEQPHLEP